MFVCWFDEIIGKREIAFSQGFQFILLWLEHKLENRRLCLYHKIYKKILFSSTSQITLCSYYFCMFQKKGPRPKWTIYKHVSDKNKKFPSSEFCLLLSVVSSASATNTSLCRDLQYLLKVQYIIQDYPNRAGFLFFIFEIL